MFLKYTSAVIVCPGGYGTLDEMFETLTLIQTQKISHLPLILMGKEYWKDLVGWLKREMYHQGYIEKNDLSLFHIVDDPQESIRLINKFYSIRADNANFI